MQSAGAVRPSASRSAFRQKDVERAIRAASNTGQPARRIEILPGGVIAIHIGEPDAEPDAEPGRQGVNDWDD